MGSESLTTQMLSLGMYDLITSGWRVEPDDNIYSSRASFVGMIHSLGKGDVPGRVDWVAQSGFGSEFEQVWSLFEDETIKGER
jgi:hypothetical protein